MKLENRHLHHHAPRIIERPISSTTSAASSYGWVSSNWSGYALASNTQGAFNSITGQWVVPSILPSKKPTYSSAWIGIDGFNNSDLIQVGTEHDFINGSAVYYAWWEILPAPETQIDPVRYPVKAGDLISASITKSSDQTWTITISNETQNWNFTLMNVNYTGPQTSAEWIMEAPTVGGNTGTLANYGETRFDPGTVNGVDPGLHPLDAGVMIQRRKHVSTPSIPDNDTDGFNVAYGSIAPNPPQS